METRTITEYKYFVLMLADVRGGVDNSTPVCVFDDKQKAIDFYNSQLADKFWVDVPSPDSFGNTHGYNKIFKKGSILEWFNPIGGGSRLVGYDFPRDGSYVFGCIREFWTREQGNFTIPLNPV